jgi:hypothetical protein
MKLDWITARQAAEKWGITTRRVQALCINGQIEGVTRLDKVWLIPHDAPKPSDGRYKKALENAENGGNQHGNI